VTHNHREKEEEQKSRDNSPERTSLVQVNLPAENKKKVISTKSKI